MSKRTAGAGYEYANSFDEDRYVNTTTTTSDANFDAKKTKLTLQTNSAPPPTPLGFGPPAPPKPPTDAEIYAEQLRQEANPNGTRTSTRVKRITTSRFPGLTKLFFSETPSTDKRLRKVHSNPNVYVIDNFLTKIELDHIAARCDLDIPIQTDYSQEIIMKEEEHEQTVLLETTTVEPTLETSQPVPVVPVVPIVAQPIPIAQPQMQSFATQPPAPLSQPQPQQTQEPYPLQTGQPLLAPAEPQPVKVKKPRKMKQKKAAPPDEFGLRLAAALNASPIKSIAIRPGNTDGGAVAGAAVATTTDTTTSATTTTTTKPTPTPIIPQTPLPPPPLQPITQFYVLGSPPKPPTLPKPPSTEPLTSPYLQGGGVKTGSPVKKNKKFKKSYTDDSTTLTRNAEGESI
ncbi:hypothetical protein TL16_g09276 [Triparma laevis f. inornata]|uniref:Uncharacterized protein n=1 Tax=Triparma laevis f. inornata TaxID=1714386 RepID=A0A9W7B7F9_9STRA|nr:hypothetical protein TL16_g09276 [Triparma laevis f. inornata]